MPHPFRARAKPFLDTARREWQFAAFAWLLRHCGGFAKFRESVPVLPIAEHFPDHGMSGHAAASALFRRVRDHAGMADWPCIVEPLHIADRAGDAATAAARIAAPADGIRVIHYQPGHCPGPGPAHANILVAHFACELARYLVDTLDEEPPGGALFREPAIEIAAVFMGFGVFLSNAALETAAAHLNEGERVHALALFCLLSRIPPDSLERHLNPHLRKYLRLADLDLRQHDSEFQRLRLESGVLTERYSQPLR